jgi:hypothetical protein
MNIYEPDDQTEAPQALTFEEFEEHKARCEELLVVGKASAKLVENPEFKAIVQKLYFEEEPIRLAQLMVSGKLTPKSFDQCVEDLRSIGHLNQFLSGLVQSANIATNELKQLEEAREEAISSQANG